MSKPSYVMNALDKNGLLLHVGPLQGDKAAEIRSLFPGKAISWAWVRSPPQPVAGTGPVTKSLPVGSGSDALVIIVQPSTPEMDL